MSNDPWFWHKRVALAVWLVLAAACATTQAGRVDAAEGQPPKYEELIAQGEMFVQAGDDIRAEQYFAAALGQGASVDEVLPRLLGACIRAQRYSAALIYAEDYVRRASDPRLLRLVLASLYLAVGEVGRAQRTLEEMLVSAPDPHAHLMLGDLYREELLDRARADRHYRAYLAMAPTGDHAERVRRELLSAVAMPEKTTPKRRRGRGNP